MIIIKKPDYVLSVVIFLLLLNMQRAHLPKEPKTILGYVMITDSYISFITEVVLSELNEFELDGEWTETTGGQQILLIFYLFKILIL